MNRIADAFPLVYTFKLNVEHSRGANVEGIMQYTPVLDSVVVSAEDTTSTSVMGKTTPQVASEYTPDALVARARLGETFGCGSHVAGFSPPLPWDALQGYKDTLMANGVPFVHCRRANTFTAALPAAELDT